MENVNGTGTGGLNQKISCDDVISKLKDDGDFDKLRLKIIRKLKENEELRNSIVSIVKQSVALNRPGVEHMKPRQLSDAIHQEVGGKINEQISDGLWEIIRSPEFMKSEITETVKSVYDKLSRPKQDENGESSGHDPKRIRKEHDGHRSNLGSTGERETDGLSDNEPKEPPGFSQTVTHQIDVGSQQTKPEGNILLVMEEEGKEKPEKPLENDGSSPPGFNQQKEDGDDDGGGGGPLQ
ncbi:hypothetical protein Ccrd_002489 [Cynara cardunculus var. scolymus]|uniref:BOD1/SHG1 domain-containing protein n=1 Tax=Cynara cardunculus var. scolymus TaxID=59895 RepID=A0A103XR99_CYNCS|nr:hypothetical protein Ccrd_002489 [Cynara cardunculus var. scolymus]